MAADCPASPSGALIEFDHHPSFPVHPSSHREIGGPGDAAGTQNWVEVKEEPQNPLARDHRNRSSFERPTDRQG